MAGKQIPRRYGVDGDGKVRRTWNGRFPEEFDDKDILLFTADTDIKLYGHVSGPTLEAIRQAGYLYENGTLVPDPGGRMEPEKENREVG